MKIWLLLRLLSYVHVNQPLVNADVSLKIMWTKDSLIHANIKKIIISYFFLISGQNTCNARKDISA